MKMEKYHIFTKIYFILFTIEGHLACFTENKTIVWGTYLSGNRFFKECVCEDEKFTANNLKWLDNNDQEISPKGPGMSTNVYTVRNPNTLELFIENLTKTLSGSYKCVTNQNGHQYVYTYTLDVYDPMYFFNTNATQYIIEGKDSLVACEARGDKPPVISWYRDETEITNNHKYLVTPQGLIIKNVTSEDIGIYRCTATSVESLEGQIEKNIKVKIMSPPVILEIIATPNNTVIVGEELKIECIADGNPYPSYSWRHVTENITTDRNLTWREEYNTITFDSVSPDDNGTYECIAQNEADTARKAITIEVYTPPEIIYFENVTEVEGNMATLICRAKGRPKPKVFIGVDGDEDDSVTRTTINIGKDETESRLTFGNVRRQHGGLFYCNAINEVHEDLKKANLTVLHKPYFEERAETIWAWPGKPVTLNCEHESNPPATVSWKFTGNSGSQNEIHFNTFQKAVIDYMRSIDRITDIVLPLNTSNPLHYGEYKCSAVNVYGESQKIFEVIEGSRPPPIPKVQQEDIKATSVTFLIYYPDTKDRWGPPIIGFIAEYDTVQNYETVSIHNNRTWALDRPIKLEGLSPNTKYYISFAAINDVGVGPFTNKTEFTTPEKSVPEAPESDASINSTLVPSKGNRMVLKLKVPESNGMPIDYFAIKYCPVSYSDTDEQGLCKEEKIPPVTELPLNDVEYNTTYKMEIVAHNAVGNSSVSYLYFSTPDPPEKPLLSAGVIIGLSVVVVILAILLLDLLLFATRRQGLIASICYKKKEKENVLPSRDRRGLLKDNKESVADDASRRPADTHNEFEYNKTTGVVTGKHSTV